LEGIKVGLIKKKGRKVPRRLFIADYNNWQNLKEKRGLDRNFGSNTDNEEFHFTDER
jgi:hypothetical protein